MQKLDFKWQGISNGKDYKSQMPHITRNNNSNTDYKTGLFADIGVARIRWLGAKIPWKPWEVHPPSQLGYLR